MITRQGSRVHTGDGRIAPASLRGRTRVWPYSIGCSRYLHGRPRYSDETLLVLVALHPRFVSRCPAFARCGRTRGQKPDAGTRGPETRSPGASNAYSRSCTASLPLLAAMVGSLR